MSEDGAASRKRKGGRRPIYATHEERKLRNRQAQADFREKRSEYIRHLEKTGKDLDETLTTCRQEHAGAVDECHSLRYQNSLLERILLEKGKRERAFVVGCGIIS
ncbi:MAG: hypothetical protein M4579_007009 [Chaenotheca gracillima]|nr:MAG: hypothetical protein M4579_007009 [Chaenotheca gracillima]